MTRLRMTADSWVLVTAWTVAGIMIVGLSVAPGAGLVKCLIGTLGVVVIVIIGLRTWLASAFEDIDKHHGDW